MRRLLAIDAARVLALGAGACVLAWYAAWIVGTHPGHGRFLVAVFGLLNVAFGILLVIAARGSHIERFCTVAAIINGVIAGGLILLVSLFPLLSQRAGGVTLLIAVTYGGFALLQWRQVS